MTKEIQWADGAVCYAYGRQLFALDKYLMTDKDTGKTLTHCECVSFGDFQLNHIRTGDYIEASELDTEQKYNDVVEVFGLFGFKKGKDSLSYSRLSVGATHYLASNDYGIDSVSNGMAFKSYCKGRQLTYNQIIAIGKLKRMMLEREKSAPKTDQDKLPPLSQSYIDEITKRYDCICNKCGGRCCFGNCVEKGKKHDQAKPRFSLIPLEPLQDVIAVLEFGASKYGADNWKHVENPQQRYLDAAMRHIMAWQSGDLVDEESGLPHLAHAQCCLLFLQHFDK